MDSDLYEDCDGVRVRVAQFGSDVQGAVASLPVASAVEARGSGAGASRVGVGAGACAGAASGDSSQAHSRHCGGRGMPSGRTLACRSRGTMEGMSGAVASMCESEDEVDLCAANPSAVPSPQGALRSMPDSGLWQNDE